MFCISPELCLRSSKVSILKDGDVDDMVQDDDDADEDNDEVEDDDEAGDVNGENEDDEANDSWEDIEEEEEYL